MKEILGEDIVGGVGELNHKILKISSLIPFENHHFKLYEGGKLDDKIVDVVVDMEDLTD